MRSPAPSASPPPSRCPAPSPAGRGRGRRATRSRCCTRKDASTSRSHRRRRATRPASSAPRWCAPPERSCKATCTSPPTCSRNPLEGDKPMNKLDRTRPLPPPWSLPPRPALAMAFPDKTITIVVPTAAGGGNDAMARTIAQKLGPLLGQTDHRRQPRRRQRRDRQRIRGPRRAGRPHADVRLHRHARDEPGAAEAALRPGGRLRADRPGRLLADADGRQPGRAGEGRARTWWRS